MLSREQLEVLKKLNATKEMAQLETAYSESRAANLKVREAEDALCLRLANVVLMDPHWLALGDWPCEESPTGMCLYDDYDDSAHGYCLICGEPAERT